MPHITVTFSGYSWTEVQEQMYIALGQPAPQAATTTPQPRLTTLDEAFAKEEARLAAEAHQDVHEYRAQPQADQPEPARPKRSHKKQTPAPAPEVIKPIATPEPEASKEPEPEPASGDDTPALEELKDIITAAVRAVAKGGDRKILDLLPAFKSRTGLEFIAKAEDKHREDLYQLALDAGLTFEAPV